MCALFLAPLPFTISANNIQVTNASLTGDNGSSAFVQFDISWENSWRGGGLPNWDAAWVFVKYRDTGNVWHHVTLSLSGHVVPSGSGAAITTANVEPGTTWDPVTNPTVGAFVHRGIPGSGTFALTGIQLKWDYAVQGVTYTDIDDIGVFGIEMVYVPGGTFLAGHSDPGSGSMPRFALTEINSPNASLEGTGTGGIMSAAQGGAPSGTSLVADWPNGYRPIYSMKYEVSEQGFVDFLNTLTYNQQLSHGQGQPPAYPYPLGGPGNAIWTQHPSVGGITPAIMAVNGDGDTNFNEPEDGADRSCGSLAALDLFAYLDWCGLRPMTELEFEKICRGQALPLQDAEYAWGTTSIAALPYTLTAAGMSTEAVATNYSTVLGNAHYVSTSVSGRAYRNGIFAAHPTNTGRVSAGASYYGVMEMSGNLRERVVKAWGHGYGYSGKHGNGELTSLGFPDVASWPLVNSEAIYSGWGFRGGGFNDLSDRLRITDRDHTLSPTIVGDTRNMLYGGRGVRNAQ